MRCGDSCMIWVTNRTPLLIGGCLISRSNRSDPGNPAISNETRGFASPPRDGFAEDTITVSLTITKNIPQCDDVPQFNLKAGNSCCNQVVQ